MDMNVGLVSMVMHMLMDEIDLQQQLFILQYFFSGPDFLHTMILGKDGNPALQFTDERNRP
jgi:hypothetical protein